MNREQLKAIRPTIVVEKNPETELEKFQIEVLRPILKFQNELIINWFMHFIESSKPNWSFLTSYEKRLEISIYLKQNKELKINLISFVVALLTLEELQFYKKNTKELNKRLVTMLIERIHSQV